jgi:hypothetical protein
MEDCWGKPLELVLAGLENVMIEYIQEFNHTKQAITLKSVSSLNTYIDYTSTKERVSDGHRRILRA